MHEKQRMLCGRVDVHIACRTVRLGGWVRRREGETDSLMLMSTGLSPSSRLTALHVVCFFSFAYSRGSKPSVAATTPAVASTVAHVNAFNLIAKKHRK